MIDFVKRWSTALTAIALVLVAVFGFATQRRDSNRIEHLAIANSVLIHRANRETIDRQVTQCHSSDEFRKAFPDILRQLAAPSSTSNAIDFAAVPGFDNLDPALQSYLTALGAVLAASGGKPNQRLLDTAARYVEAFPLIDCDVLKRDLAKKLAAEHGP